MSSTERVLLAIAALALTLGAVELVRREIALLARRGASAWRFDATAAGALFTAVAAVGGWLAVAIGEAPLEGVVGVLAWVVVMLLLLVGGGRIR